MKVLSIHGKFGDSQLLIGEQIGNLKKYLPDRKIIVITDTNLNRLYGNRFSQFPVIVVEAGEKTKTLETLSFIISRLIELGADRHSFLVGIGGGVVCDITGFVASVFMRGIDFGFVSTSLLSQVDASVGGKNGVNFLSYKNIIGTFNQPQFVICDTEMLQTLPPEEIRSGFGEIIKHALIADEELFAEIVDNQQNVLTFNQSFFTDLVYRNVQIKATIVNRDEKESGERKKLNFGHTLGHAIEKHSDLLHGEAISIGMMFSAHLSAKKGYISQQDVEKIKMLLNNLGLPTSTNIDRKKLADAITKDKKRNSDFIDFVMIKKIGEAIVERISIDELKTDILNYE